MTSYLLLSYTVEQIPVCTSTFLFGTLDLGIKFSEQSLQERNLLAGWAVLVVLFTL